MGKSLRPEAEVRFLGRGAHQLEDLGERFFTGSGERPRSPSGFAYI